VRGSIKIIQAQVRAKGVATTVYYSITTRDLHGHYSYSIVKGSTLRKTVDGRRALDRYANNHRINTSLGSDGEELSDSDSAHSISEDTIPSADDSGADSPQPVNPSQHDHKINQ
jgi:hypothetical protein